MTRHSNDKKSIDRGADIVAIARPKSARSAMGKLEAATFRAACAEVKAFRAFVAAITTDRTTQPTNDVRRGFAALRPVVSRNDEEDDGLTGKNGTDTAVVTRVVELAARLMFARLFDERPALLEDLRRRAPTIVIDIPDPDLFKAVTNCWKSILFDPKRLRKIVSDGSRHRHRDDDALFLVVRDPPKPAHRADLEHTSLEALSIGLPLVAISPSGNSYLPACILKAAAARIEMGQLDAATIERVVRIVTGKRVRQRLDAATTTGTPLADLAIAVRFDREPEECLAELDRLAAVRHATKDARDLTLAQLHGLGEARGWAEMAIADIKAWRVGKIGWSAVASAVALTGLPGTGKTTFAKVFAAEAGLDLITATLAKWQASGEAHLGHLLRAMRQDFQDARARSPCVLFIDEIDSFPDRASLTHSHKDYQIEVVNSLLELVDGIAGREGVVLIGASNDLSRCDPALLRSGRFERIVGIGLPGQEDREKMLRVRLGPDLSDMDLEPIAEATVGMTGADIERVVNDARRFARRASRALIEEDLRKAVTVEDTRPFELRWRACVHEAGHLVVDVLYFGPDNIFATVAVSKGAGGMSVRTKQERASGTYARYHKELQIILAGRVAEELLLDGGGDGAGGRSGSDLERGTAVAAAMVGSFGLAGPTPLIYRGDAEATTQLLRAGDVRAAVDAELSKAAAACRELLTAHAEALMGVATVLSVRSRIDGDRAASIIAASQKSGRGCMDARTTGAARTNDG